MRFLLVLVPMLAAACAPVPEPAAAPRTTAAPPQREVAKAAPPVAAQQVSVPGIVTTSAPMACPDRPERLRRAKETIRTWQTHMAEIMPVMKFIMAHKCELKDTSGSVLVSRKREAGGVRITTTQGHPDDIVCDVPADKFPDELDRDAMLEYVKLDNTDEDAPLVSFGEACRDPELEVTYADRAKQKKILALE